MTLRLRRPGSAATFRQVAEIYQMPADVDQVRRRPRRLTPWHLAHYKRRIQFSRDAGQQRLAWLDSTFPWRRSGFRYHEALAFHEALPDTMFFSDWQLTDDFPAPVFPLSDFPMVASEAGITDAYAVFQNFLAGIAGLPPVEGLRGHPLVGPNLWSFLRRSGIHLHGTIYPGGGFVPTPAGLERAGQLSSRLHTTFSYVPEVLEHVRDVHSIPQALTDVAFYRPTSRRWMQPLPLRCLFVADAEPRKGFDLIAQAFQRLDPAKFQVDVIGPYENRRFEIPSEIARFHGWLEPENLRELHAHAHAVISPVRASDEGITDGFPTQAAADAMSSGCLLLGSNPGGDHRVLTAGIHYVPCEASANSVTRALESLASNPDAMQAIADRGSNAVRQQMNIRDGALHKLALMGFRPKNNPNT